MNRQFQMITPTGAPRVWFMVLVIGLAFGIVSALGIAYTSSVQRETERRFGDKQLADNQKWCKTFREFIAPLPTTPPRSPQEARSRRVTEGLKELYDYYQCDQVTAAGGDPR